MLRELAGEDKIASRKNQARQLIAIMRNGSFEPVEDHDGFTNDPKKYVRASRKIFDRFTSQPDTKRFTHAGVEHGFNVCGRIVMRGVQAYAADQKDTDRQASVEELTAILSRSYDPSITTFTDKDPDVCKKMEYAFGLIRGSAPLEPLPFVIKEVDGEDKLIPSPSISATVSLRIKESFRDMDINGSCPARGIVLQQVWAATIGTCALNQHLLPADVDRINAGTYQMID